MEKYILFITLSLITMNVLAKSDKDYCQTKYKNATEARIDAKCFGHYQIVKLRKNALFQY